MQRVHDVRVPVSLSGKLPDHVYTTAHSELYTPSRWLLLRLYTRTHRSIPPRTDRPARSC